MIGKINNQMTSGAVLPNWSYLYDHGRIYDHLAKMVVFWSYFWVKSRIFVRVRTIYLLL